MNFLGNNTDSASFSPRLLIAGHFVRAGKVGGAEQMLYNLLLGLSVKNIDTTLICGDRENISKDFLPILESSKTLRLVECGGRGNRFFSEQRACLNYSLSSNAILFPNYYVPPIIPSRLGRVGVVIHDFQYRHFPQYFSAKKRAWLHVSQAAAMRLADRIIVISDFVREDAIRWFGEKFANKIAVIPNALSWDRFADGIGYSRPLSDRYILSVAAQYPHKNLETLIRAFAIVARRDRGIKLVLCGQNYRGLSGVMQRHTNIDHLISEFGLTDRIHLTGFVDNKNLARWYEHAEMFVFPSIFEGFGMPPVEALSFALPTLTTRRTAIPETTFGLAQMVEDPFNIDEWASHIIEMLRNPDVYRPSIESVDKIKNIYDPAVIANSYINAMS